MEQKEYTVREVGNSLVVTIPTDLARKHDIKKGDKVFYTETSESISITKKETKETDYYDILENVMNDSQEAIVRLIDL